jgi:quinohemoprotein amine dehydrogenase
MHVGYFPDSEGAAFRRFGPPTGEPQPAEQAVEYLAKAHPLWTPEWSAWQAKMRPARMAGKWLVTARLPGYGNYTGELNITAGAASDEFTTRLRLQPVSTGPVLERTGRGLVYVGYSWRGRSNGTAAGDTPSAIPAEMREVLWISPDGSEATGRWFWGSYDEFGFHVRLLRASGAPVLL